MVSLRKLNINARKRISKYKEVFREKAVGESLNGIILNPSWSG
jgi:hypothetical protein